MQAHWRGEATSLKRWTLSKLKKSCDEKALELAKTTETSLRKRIFYRLVVKVKREHEYERTCIHRSSFNQQFKI